MRSDSTLLRASTLSHVENPKDGVSTASLGNLFHRLTILSSSLNPVRKALISACVCVVSHPPTMHHCELTPSLQQPSCSTGRLPLGLLRPPLLQAEQAALPQPLLIQQLLPG